LLPSARRPRRRLPAALLLAPAEGVTRGEEVLAMSIIRDAMELQREVNRLNSLAAERLVMPDTKKPAKFNIGDRVWHLSGPWTPELTTIIDTYDLLGEGYSTSSWFYTLDAKDGAGNHRKDNDWNLFAYPSDRQRLIARLEDLSDIYTDAANTIMHEQDEIEGSGGQA
jgi:hypothetical protein